MNNYIEILQNSILPKFLNLIVNPNKKQMQKTYFAQLIPKDILNITAEEYIKENGLCTLDIIINSIRHTQIKLSDEEILDISKLLEPLAEKYSLRILTESGTAIYLEVLNIINYIIKIQAIIKSYPKSNANHHGTKHRSSSEKNLIKPHRAHLVERLENPFFAIEDEKLKEITQLQIKYIDLFQTKEHKTLPDAMNWVESIFGLDVKMLDFPTNKLVAMKQVLSLFNGIRTSKEELIKSIMIYIQLQSKLDISDKSTNMKYADAIYKFTEYLFMDIFLFDARKKKRTLTFTDKSIIKPYYSKTVINDLPIFAYVVGKQEDFLMKYALEGLASMADVESFDDSNKTEKSTYKMLRSFYKSFFEYEFSRQDISTLLKIMQIYEE